MPAPRTIAEEVGMFIAIQLVRLVARVKAYRRRRFEGAGVAELSAARFYTIRLAGAFPQFLFTIADISSKFKQQFPDY